MSTTHLNRCIRLVWLCVAVASSMAAAQEPSSPLKISEEATYLAESVAANAGRIHDIRSNGTYSAKYMTTKTHEEQQEEYEWAFEATPGAERFSLRHIENTILAAGATGDEKQRRLSLYDCTVSWVEGRVTELRGGRALIRRQANPPDLLPFGHDPRTTSFAISDPGGYVLGGLLNPDIVKKWGRAEAEVVQKNGATWTLEVRRFDLFGRQLVRQQYEIETDKGFVISRARAWTSPETAATDEWANTSITEVGPGIWLATSNERTRRDSRDAEPRITRMISSGVAVNSGLTPQKLALVIPAGTGVRDEITGLEYMMPKDAIEGLDLGDIAHTMVATTRAQSRDVTSTMTIFDKSVPEATSHNSSASHPYTWIGIAIATTLVCVGIAILIVARRRGG